MKKGFTLIELLIVIAIIGVLAGVVLASLNSSRTQALDSKVKGQMHGFRQQAEIIYSESGNAYGTADPTNDNCPNEADTLSGDSKVQTILDNMPEGTTVKCLVTPGARDAFAVIASLVTGNSGDFWCIDSASTENLINLADVSALDSSPAYTCTDIDALN